MKPFIFLLAFTLAGYWANATADPEPANGNGRKEEVLGLIQHAENKKPLAKVNITAYLLSEKQKSVVSDDNGNYSFDDLKPGTYRLTFEKAGYKKVTKEKVVIKTDEGFLINIEMEETRPLEFGPSALHFSGF